MFKIYYKVIGNDNFFYLDDTDKGFNEAMQKVKNFAKLNIGMKDFTLMIQCDPNNEDRTYVNILEDPSIYFVLESLLN